MKKIYDFVGGRKLFVFYFIFTVNFVSLLYNKWTEQFGFFCVLLYGVIVSGVESTKIIRGKYGFNNQDKPE